MTEKVDLIIKNGTVLSFDENDNRFDNGVVIVKDGVIVDVGEQIDILRDYDAKEVIDVDGDLIMPGLINGHTHAAMSALRGYSDDLPLDQWLEHIIPAENKIMGKEMVYWGTLVSAAEMIRSGITTVCDSYFFEEDAARAFIKSGMRAICAQGVVDFPTPQWQDPAAKFDVVEEFLDNFPEDDSGMVMPALFVHAPYTASPETYHRAGDLASKSNARVFTHLAETEGEVEDIRKKYGRTPVRHLEKEGVLNESFTAVHVNWVDDGEIEILSSYGSSVVVCPGSGAKLAAGVAPVTAFIDAGIPVGLGTDGPASNNRQDLFYEMDMLAKLQKVISKDAASIKAKTVLATVLFLGAEALGMEEKIGCLKKGMAADIIIVDLTRPHAAPLFDYPSHLVYSARGFDVKTNIINGRVVYHWGKVYPFDEPGAIARLFEIGNRLI
ncbi:MAG: amidohydrolase [Deltaproteobacteria bacterium]|uniref:5-methylthioadenosine/S-adenosylhomocysteine deaminase n=1 Tax=Candidatus Zymogenus saltonus TaxID=2844893 RepID=A0A9D8KFQ0_9DELT|nr:amidohydrolase [Candidatus Zymogenus saltonus]